MGALDQSPDDRLIADRFELIRLLGDGSFAQVFEALDRDLGRQVALKLFSTHATDELDAALHEARAMARLNHENVLVVHDIGEHRGTPFLALEYATTDLRRWLTGEHESAAILQRFCEAGRGLEAAHDAGLVHHDFKPANVLIRPDGSVAVGDFGLARHLDVVVADESEPGGRHTYGTLRYIAPERLLGHPGDERSDQFSFCVAVWEALGKANPFCGADAERRLDSIVAGPNEVPKAPPHILGSLRRGLEFEPDDRFANMSELLTALAAGNHTRPAVSLRQRALSSLKFFWKAD